MSPQEKESTSCEEYIYSNEYQDLIYDYSTNILAFDEQKLKEFYDAQCVQLVSSRFVVVHKKLGKEGLQINDVTYRAIPKLYGLMDTSNMEQSGVLKLRRQSYLNFLGKDVIVGFVDTGIDYTNKLFINADNTSRIKVIWDQTIRTGKSPGNFQYGTEYSQEDINRALASEEPLKIVPSMDEDGHGTFMAGITAGNNDTENDFTGVVPLADIAVVKLKESKQYLKDFFGVPEHVISYQENDIMMGIRYLLTYASIVKKPIVICIGLGTSAGDHNGNSPLSNYINDVSRQSGTVVTCAAGNEANTGHHYKGILKVKENEDLELKIGKDETTFTLELWTVQPGALSISIISPSGEIAEKIPGREGTTDTIKFVFEPTIFEVTYRRLEIGTGDELIFIRVTKPIEGVWKFRVYNEFNIEAVYHVWLPISNFMSKETYFLRPEPYVTLVETATAEAAIVSSTYNHVTNSVYVESSRGYTRSGAIKPDLAAPGVNIYGPVKGNKFGRRSGSSIAVAHLAGVCAMLLEWALVEENRKIFNSSEVKTLLIAGANRTDITYPNREWGYGTLDVYSTFESLRRTVTE